MAAATDVPAITARLVHDALRGVRYARPLGESPLTRLALVEQRLRAEHLADTAPGRAWALTLIVEDAVREQLEQLDDPGTMPGAEPRPAEVAQALAAAIESGSHEREAWALLYCRFLARGRKPFGQVIRRLGMSERTVRRRLAESYELLAEWLRRHERAAARQTAAGSGVSPGERSLRDDDVSGPQGIGRRISRPSPYAPPR